MKYNSRFNHALLAVCTAAALPLQSIHAQIFVADRGDLLWTAREENDGSRGTKDFIVNLGSYTRFISGTDALLLGGASASEAYQGAGPLITSENRFRHADVLATFSNLDNIYSSAFGVNSGASPTANSSWFLTRARTDVGTQSTPWNRNSAFSQGGTGNKMESVREFADGDENAANAPFGAGQHLSSTSTRTDTSFSVAYGNASVSPFTGYNTMEVGTGTGFNTKVRLDLYAVPPGSGPSSYLGHFEYQADGDLWWVPKDYNLTPVPEPPAFAAVIALGLLGFSTYRKFKARRAALQAG